VYITDYLLGQLSTDELNKNGGKLGQLLSRNDQFHRYAETTDEFMTNLIIAHERGITTEKIDPDVMYATTWEAARKKNTSYGEIIACNKLMDAMVASLVMHEYFTQTKLFQPYWLQKNVIDKAAGVSDLI
jgi:hypothetical protein